MHSEGPEAGQAVRGPRSPQGDSRHPACQGKEHPVESRLSQNARRGRMKYETLELQHEGVRAFVQKRPPEYKDL
jgi:hypothetical protein